jgi:uncharacterized protein with FMN-binding domain
MMKRSLDSRSGAGKRVSHGLVALSSAAVLTVYSAGYARTRSAAARFDVPAGNRRSGPRGAAPPHVWPLPPAATASSSALIASGTAPDIEAAPKPAHGTPMRAEPAPPAEPLHTPEHTAAPSTQPLPSTPVATSVPAPASASAHEATPSVAAPESTPAAASAQPPAPASPAFTEAPPVDPSEQPFVFRGAFKKDGTFLGWGYSRHGDIQASVQIENGRIVSAVIAQCLTRYSCDVIDKLPPQVAARQSADVDHVSGATESADAFYDAIVDALSKAK